MRVLDSRALKLGEGVLVATHYRTRTQSCIIYIISFSSLISHGSQDTCNEHVQRFYNKHAKSIDTIVPCVPVTFNPINCNGYGRLDSTGSGVT